MSKKTIPVIYDFLIEDEKLKNLNFVVMHYNDNVYVFYDEKISDDDLEYIKGEIQLGLPDHDLLFYKVPYFIIVNLIIDPAYVHLRSTIRG